MIGAPVVVRTECASTRGVVITWGLFSPDSPARGRPECAMSSVLQLAVGNDRTPRAPRADASAVELGPPNRERVPPPVVVLATTPAKAAK